MSTPTILTPLDQSELAEAALPYAEAVSVALQAPIRLFGVANEGGQGLISVSPELLTSLKQMRRRTR